MTNKKWKIRSSDAAPLFAMLCLLMNIPAIQLTYLYVLSSEEKKFTFFFSILLEIFILLYIFFEIFILPKLYRFFLGSLFYLNLIVLYFMTHYSVVPDKNVVISLLTTNWRETSEYMTIPYIILLIAGFLGIFLLAIRLEIIFLNLKKETKRKSLTLLLLVFLFGLNLSLFFRDYAFFLREEKVFKHLLLPINYMDAVYGAIQKTYAKNKPLHNIHLSSRINDKTWMNVSKKTVYVLVVGETARAQSFSIDGYIRKTNPRLESIENLVSFLNTTSCGTSTSISVPCIFDHRGREKFANSDENFTNLLDIAKNTGFDVTWIDNNTGCQDVCRRVKEFNLKTLPDAKDFCSGDACYDAILLSGLKQVIASSQEDKNFIVLHMLGSHGPKYYKRYPEDYAHFQPDCHSDDLTSCSQEEIINSYDNTILYTDHVLSQIIHYLQGLKDWNSNFIYISDHGESLGEKGLYLHAVPFRFAPEEQTHVPFLFWSNQSFLKEFNYNIECIKNEQKLLLSHNHVFHSYLRLMGIDSPHYIKERDIFVGCIR
jgi:lipid A ethanolaminephosphotransferase